MRSLSLRFRLTGLIGLAMALCLLLGSLLAGFGAQRSVRTEMQAAFAVANQAIESVLTGPASRVDRLAALANLIAAFNGNRHVRLQLRPPGTVAAAPLPESPAVGSVPAWFASLVAVEAQRLVVPVAAAGDGQAVVIETDPHNEIVETWNAFCNTVLSLGLFCGLTLVVIHVVLGRALRPLDRLGRALDAIGGGDYSVRTTGRLAPELARLQERFNHMARRLAEAKAQNLGLHAELLTLQEAERRDIARDLHDEIGPFLFAVNVDAAAVLRLAEAGRVEAIPAAVQGITGAVAHMQEQVRTMLGRLRPIGLEEFGLAAALDNLVAFWRQRRPTIEFRLAVAPSCRDLGDLLDTTVYRIVQEGLSNAIRHGRPGSIAVAVHPVETGAAILVEVADDGCGAAEAVPGGLGLVGMAERVRGLGGTLTRENRPGGGFVVRAVLPAAAHRAGGVAA